MKIPININIKTLKVPNNIYIDDEFEPETEMIETNTFGFLKSTKKGLQLEYVEDEGSGFKGTVTTVSMLGENVVSVNRIGPLNSHMVFEKGKIHNCVYDNGVIPMEIRISTKELKNGITRLGGKLDIDYTVEIIGSYAEKNHLSLSVAPHESVITS